MGKMRKSGFESLAKESQLYRKASLLQPKKRKNTFFIQVPKEISRQEKWITLMPDAVICFVEKTMKYGLPLSPRLGCNFSNRQYSDAGAKIVYSAEEVYPANAILKN